MFVTVGTIRFDALIEEVDRLVEGDRIPDSVILQIANGSYVPQHCRWFRFEPSIEHYIKEASLVISHGGTTMHQVLRLGKRLIAVPNPDLAADHQRLHIRALSEMGYLLWCDRLSDLESLIRSDAPLRPYEPESGQLVDDIRRFIDNDTGESTR